ncbi:MAG: DUF6448 family protein [Candidatus Omnitrophica bacterium]|nr:DUF6448 family protein [Candidatus Omnitrophota bacterium]MDD5670737.1 DUF6448 family protein [Candidatus Omnitrophota bacterium]
MKARSDFSLPVISIIVFGIIALLPCEVFSHCDTMDGPVVKDAHAALENGDVTPTLKWVKKDAEPEIQSAFQTALAERGKGHEAKDAADKKFFETLIRVHRAGEGAPFTGLKPAGSIEPVIAKADQALETESVDALTSEMSKHITQGVKKRFESAFEKRKHKEESIEAGREYVEAYVEYIHYVEGIHNAASGKGGHHHEASEATEHEDIES